MREIVHLQAGQCGNQIGAKVSKFLLFNSTEPDVRQMKNSSPLSLFYILLLMDFLRDCAEKSTVHLH